MQSSSDQRPARKQRRIPFTPLTAILPLDRKRLPLDLMAGVTLAALAIPEVMGYAKIAGMPVYTGLYTILLPIAVFALLGSSRHLVVGADSATAAILASGVGAMAVLGSSHYVALAGDAALLAGVLLIIARLARLGFLANFLSRTVLIGFLTGVGIQVAISQIGSLIGENKANSATFTATMTHLATTNLPTLAISAGVLILIVGIRRLTRAVPGALLAVAGSLAASAIFDLRAHGVAIISRVPGGLPPIRIPAFTIHIGSLLLATAVSMVIVIIAQSAATSRAYAAKYDEDFDENTDLVGLGVANFAAALTGTFVVNGSPTKTQMVDSAGGRSQLSQLTAAVAVLLVLLFLTGPLQYLPSATLAAVVFLIGVELIDVKGMRKVFAVRRDEFAIACLTALTVIFIGVEQGIILAIALSMIDHIRQGYAPHNAVLVPSPEGHWRSEPVQPQSSTEAGIIVYRFGSSLYYANCGLLLDQLFACVKGQPALSWVCIDSPAIRDVDYSAAQALLRLSSFLKERHVRLTFCELSSDVQRQLERYGILKAGNAQAVFDTPMAVLDAYHQEKKR